MESILVKIASGEYENNDAVENVIRYVLRLDNSNLVGGCGVFLATTEEIIQQFYSVKKFYRVMDKKQVMHFVFSPNPQYLIPEIVLKKLGYMLAGYFQNDRQVVFAVHNDTDHLHIHMAVNTVAYTNGAYKAYWDLDELKQYALVCMGKIIDEYWLGRKN